MIRSGTDTLDLRDYLRVLSRRWRAITVLALLGTAVGVLITYTATPEYRASAKLFVSVREGSDTLQLAQGNVFTQARVRSYAEVAASPMVTRHVVRTLRLDMTPSQLSRRISASTQPDTVLIRLTVTDTWPERAARISNAVAERFTEVVRDLERPAGAETSPVRLSVTQPASVPSVPFSPRPAVNVALGLLAGLVLGAGLAVARESMDRSVRTLQALTEFLAGFGGPPVLGSVTHDPRATRHPVALLDDMHGPRAEGFRRLRTSLRFVDVDQPPRVIAVTSPLPREGKTSVAINLAATLAETGASVCLVDTDLRRPSTAHVMGLVRDAGLTTVLIGQAEVHQVLQSVGSFSVLTSGSVPPNPAELLGSSQLRAVLRSLAEKFDHVVVDTAPVLPVADASVIASVVDGYLLVVRASHTSREQVGAALRTLQHVGASVLGTVLNMTSSKEEGNTYGYAYEYRPQRRKGGRFSKRRRSLYVPPAGRAPVLPTPGGEPGAQVTAAAPAAAVDGETRSMTADGSAQR
ncbi:polysaccharide biosynthesis tyrosine autokinase [Streptomyces capitiformicae]|uniref:polysaccharide biosynthesis tyrosine autokinase n=1 Tax=Streptomyces capitiformicae TaxID=2014920 RepID=UPI001E6231CD|nr:polysaccharide biosynthesis tyrosine autokinase [Streptomyces capitiformicae]